MATVRYARSRRGFRIQLQSPQNMSGSHSQLGDHPQIRPRRTESNRGLAASWATPVPTATDPAECPPQPRRSPAVAPAIGTYDLPPAVPRPAALCLTRSAREPARLGRARGPCSGLQPFAGPPRPHVSTFVGCGRRSDRGYQHRRVRQPDARWPGAFTTSAPSAGTARSACSPLRRRQAPAARPGRESVFLRRIERLHSAPRLCRPDR